MSQLKLHFQLPYYIDGDVKLTQSNAILRYISKKHGLGKICLSHELIKLSRILNCTYAQFTTISAVRESRANGFK